MDSGHEWRWQLQPDPATATLGLTTGMGKLLDGIHRPADLPPGELGIILFQNAIQPHESGRAQVTAIAGGRIDLVYPDDTTYPLEWRPEDSEFVVVSIPNPLTVSDIGT